MKPWKLIPFALYYGWQLLLATGLLVWEILTPSSRLHAAVVRVPLRCTTDVEIAAFANLVSLTPGTLSLDVTPDGEGLYVHGLHFGSDEQLIEELLTLEDRLLEVLR